jgi:hypothetical protein
VGVRRYFLDRHDVSVDDLQYVPAIVAAIATAVGLVFGERAPLSEAGRLRSAVATDLTILEKLPPSPAAGLLTKHVELQVQRLIVLSEPPTARERDALRWGRRTATVGIAFIVLPAPQAAQRGGELSLVESVIFAIGCALLGLGLYLWTRAELNFTARRRQLMHSILGRPDSEVSGG